MVSDADWNIPTVIRGADWNILTIASDIYVDILITSKVKGKVTPITGLCDLEGGYSSTLPRPRH